MKTVGASYLFLFSKRELFYITEIICHSWYIILLHLVVKKQTDKIVGDNIQQCSRISESDSNAAAAAAFSRDIFRRITTVVQDFFLETDYNNRTLNRILVVGILLQSSCAPGALVVVEENPARIIGTHRVLVVSQLWSCITSREVWGLKPL